MEYRTKGSFSHQRGGKSYHCTIVRSRQISPLSLDSIVSIVDYPFDYRRFFCFTFVFHSLSVPTIQFDIALSRSGIDLLIGCERSPQMRVKCTPNYDNANISSYKKGTFHFFDESVHLVEMYNICKN